jgi:tetratricopeptide (TPR) repeat protein
LYAQGVAYGLRANYNFLVRKAWMDALRDATQARKLHNRVTELDPSFIDARLVQGVHDYVVGSLPFAYKLLGFLVGFRGDREKGMQTLRLVSEKGDKNKLDAQVLLAAIYRRERRPKDALPLVESLAALFPRNYLFQFEISQMHSDLGNKREALAALQRVEDLKKAGSPGYSRLHYEKIYFSRGTIYFWYGDLDEAVRDFRRVVARSEELDLSTGVMAWLRLGQIHDLKGQRPEAVEAYRKAIALAPESEAAKESRRYITAPYKRNAAAASLRALAPGA